MRLVSGMVKAPALVADDNCPMASEHFCRDFGRIGHDKKWLDHGHSMMVNKHILVSEKALQWTLKCLKR